MVGVLRHSSPSLTLLALRENVSGRYISLSDNDLQERFNKTIPFAKVLGKLNQLDVDSWVGARRCRLWKHCLEPSSPTVVRRWRGWLRFSFNVLYRCLLSARISVLCCRCVSPSTGTIIGTIILH